MSLQKKTINGLFWSFTDSFANQGVQFIIGIILARLLSPKEFGLIGMLTIFIAISQSLVDSGFSQALIRKVKCTQKDYSTVFFFNIWASLIIYFVLFAISKQVARFFEEEQLTILLRVLGAGIILNSFSIIQRAILVKRIDFKTQTKISLFSSFFSGLVAVYMAYSSYGVWSLVALTLVRYGLNSILFWVWAKWKPTLEFSKQSFRELFSFGGKLLLSGLIDTVYRNVYYLIIGKYFTASSLGYYTKADQFKGITSQNLQLIISRVSYPVLASLQEDKVRLKEAYEKIIRNTMLPSFMLMLGMAATAEPLVISLLGQRWEQSIVYLQLLSFVGMLYPLHALNLNMLKVLGRSDLFLRLEVLKKIFAVPVILLGIYYGIETMIWSMVIHSILAFFLNSHWSGKILNYSSKEQLIDILPALLLAVAVNSTVYGLSVWSPLPAVWTLLSCVFLGAFLTIAIGELGRLRDYLSIKNILFEKAKNNSHG